MSRPGSIHKGVQEDDPEAIRKAIERGQDENIMTHLSLCCSEESATRFFLFKNSGLTLVLRVLVNIDRSGTLSVRVLS